MTDISLKRAYGPEYYDDAISDPASPHLLPNPESPWHDLYTAVARILGNAETRTNVVDLGCGTGRLAALIDPARGISRTLSYLGVDFSQKMLDEAVRYTRERHEHTRCRFERHDLHNIADVEATLTFADATYLLLEVLEHLDDDHILLEALPAGARVIISVPSTDSDAHVRYFPNVDDALERYHDTVDFETWQRIWTPERQGFWHLMTGTTKGTSE